MSQPMFRCHDCEKASRYRVRAQVPRFDAVVMDREATPQIDLSQFDESRTYVCEHCSAHNVIKKRAADWKTIGA